MTMLKVSSIVKPTYWWLTAAHLTHTSPCLWLLQCHTVDTTRCYSYWTCHRCRFPIHLCSRSIRSSETKSREAAVYKLLDYLNHRCDILPWVCLFRWVQYESVQEARWIKFTFDQISDGPPLRQNWDFNSIFQPVGLQDLTPKVCKRLDPWLSSQIRLLGTEYKCVACFKQSQDILLALWTSHYCFLVGNGSKDRICLRRQSDGDWIPFNMAPGYMSTLC